jgi:hypothetical protein
LRFFARPASQADLPNPQKIANECSTSSVPLFVSPMRDNGAPGEAHDDLILLSQATINPSHSLENLVQEKFDREKDLTEILLSN